MATDNWTNSRVAASPVHEIAELNGQSAPQDCEQTPRLSKACVACGAADCAGEEEVEEESYVELISRPWLLNSPRVVSPARQTSATCMERAASARPPTRARNMPCSPLMCCASQSESHCICVCVCVTPNGDDNRVIERRSRCAARGMR